jgi:hypothetical protein
VNGRIKRLTLKEFLLDIYQVVRSPAQRFAIIDERGLQWGALILLIIPAYFTFEFIGAIYFNHDPFPGYSFVMPAIIAAGFQLVRVWSIHRVARLLCGTSRLPGRARFSQLLAVYGYTTLPTMLVIAPAIFVWVFSSPDPMGIPGIYGSCYQHFDRACCRPNYMECDPSSVGYASGLCHALKWPGGAYALPEGK